MGEPRIVVLSREILADLAELRELVPGVTDEQALIVARAVVPPESVEESPPRKIAPAQELPNLLAVVHDILRRTPVATRREILAELHRMDVRYLLEGRQLTSVLDRVLKDASLRRVHRGSYALAGMVVPPEEVDSSLPADLPEDLALTMRRAKFLDQPFQASALALAMGGGTMKVAHSLKALRGLGLVKKVRKDKNGTGWWAVA